ncbi:glycosyl hydrolase family 61-domain-containing protein [Epithele typhae]|uniref:glycosyl hydrolase family 61-domain-containing protein n=1 Tax=Epithele typhae TaxID=378194 RepID=UPI0020079304|nr:glycosyl hydrolase family 61-domain-containing protein [Epithele typhae]KAH9913138.1 glycosyl hydrolase family 61-domain-containing protein [Epithele typhae]
MKTSAAIATFTASLAATLPLVAGHGFVSWVEIDGTKYLGNVPNNYKGPSPIRLISDIGPVKGASNPDLFCGLSAQPAELVASANSGSTVAFQWSGGAGQKWPHNTGPFMTYMASCGDVTCDKFNSTDAQWFKIDQVGKKSDGTTWVQADIMNGDSFTVTLPDNLTPGDYLIRHEIIALHLAVTEGGAEFYPRALSDTDPGIFDPNVFNGDDNYVFPGGALSNLAGTFDGTGDAITGASTFPSTSGATSTKGAAGTKTASGSSATATTTATAPRPPRARPTASASSRSAPISSPAA